MKFFAGGGYFWFRVRGYGARIKLLGPSRPCLFSERVGIKPAWHVGPFCIQVLK
jgi:hypothetical protein